MKPPVFIIGNPRSGTTLLRLMLNNHKNIVVPPECGFAVWWYDNYKNWNQHLSQNKQHVESFIHDLSTSRKVETWNLDYATLGDFIQAKKPANYTELVSSVYIYFGISNQRTFQRWGDKNNFHIQYIDVLDNIFPNSLFIHIVRDGRDVACSYRKLKQKKFRSKYAPNLPFDIAEIASEWTENIQMAVSQFQTIGCHRVCQVRYEDLVTASQVELTKLCEFLEEPYDEQMLNYYVYNRQEEQEPAEFLQWKSKTLESPTTSEIGKFQVKLTSEEIGLFESIAKPILVQYGYQ